MNYKRVIPCLLLRGSGLVKGAQFKEHVYIGDPINAVKIFNDKEVDELIFLDISSRERGEINFQLLNDICTEAFMPFAYGGGIRTCQQIEKLFRIGAEKVILNSELFSNPSLLKEATKVAGSQSIAACIDVRKTLFGKYEIFACNGQLKVKTNLNDYIRFLEDSGVGEIMIQSIDREGMGKGLDIALSDEISKSVNVPVIASGGVSSLQNIKDSLTLTAISAIAASSLFVFHGKHRAVLITYPSQDELELI